MGRKVLIITSLLQVRMKLLVLSVFLIIAHEFMFVFPLFLSTLSIHSLDHRHSCCVHIRDDGKRQQMIYRS